MRTLRQGTLTALPNVTEQVHEKNYLPTVPYFEPNRAQTMTLLLDLWP